MENNKTSNLIKNTEQIFLDTSEWKYYYLYDLFNSSNGDFDIQKKHIEKEGSFVVSSGITNYGIIGRTKINAKIFKENTITVDMFGNSFFRNHEYKMATHGRVFSLEIKYNNASKYEIMFIATVLNNILPILYGYNNMCSWNKIMGNKIKLPSKFNPENELYEPDWAFMQQYILNLYDKLNIEKIKNNIDNINKIEKKDIDTIQWKQYNVASLFNFEIAKSLDKSKVIESKKGINYITRQSTNNGLEFKVQEIENKKNLGNCITISMVGENKGCAFYQKDDFLSSQNMLVLRNNNISKKIAFFLIVCIEKTYRISSDYNAIKKSDLFNTYITLPSKFNKEINKYEPDWEYMELYISELEKNIES